MIEAVTSGVDWITATLPTGALLDQDWVHKCLLCLDDVVKEGNQLEYSGLNGYKGVKAGGCFIGSREDGHMVQFSGRYADRFFQHIYRYDAHISRLDVQTTVKYHKMPKGIAKGAYRDAIKENETIPVSRRRKIYIIVGSDGGDTCYVGSPSSDQRGRIYNKEVQSEDPNYMRCWRFEASLRNDVATGLARNIAERKGKHQVFCADWTAIWFEKRGIEAPWTRDAEMPILPPVKTQPTDVEKKLNWLAHQVRPTVEYLLTVLDKEAILLLLGLS
jgi:hypothetical protein